MAGFMISYDGFRLGYAEGYLFSASECLQRLATDEFDGHLTVKVGALILYIIVEHNLLGAVSGTHSVLLSGLSDAIQNGG